MSRFAVVVIILLLSIGAGGGLEKETGEYTGQGTVLQLPPAETGYGTIDFSFTVVPQFLKNEGTTYAIFRAQNACSGKLFASLGVYEPDESDPTFVLKARGLAKPVTLEMPVQPGTAYDFDGMIDVIGETVTVTISQGGTVVGTITGQLNTDPENQFNIEATQDGVWLIINGGESGNTAWSHLDDWTFSKLFLDGAGTNNTGPVATGADLTSDEGRMAFLAANMVTLAEGNDYTLDCGPADEILALPPEEGDFCALQIGNQIVFGTFATGETAEQDILESFKNPLYDAHIPPEDIDSSACDSVSTALQEFQECPDAIDTMHTYAFIEPLSGSSFIVVSEDVIDALDTSFMEEIINFFRNLFGLPVTEGTPIVSSIPDAQMKKFHHGYFTKQNDREVAGTWFDTDAAIVYKGFSTDFGIQKPSNARYRIGNEKQALLFDDMSAASPGDVDSWRKLTAALRIADVGEPLPGDVCGNGIVGLDEECEPGISEYACSDFDPTLPNQAVECRQDCTLDINSCYESGETCGDSWIPPPDEQSCGGSLPCTCELIQALKGQTIAKQQVQSATQMFSSAGSLNKPVICAAANYVAFGDPTWFDDYFSYQKRAGSGARSWFMGTETTSPVYTGIVTGPIVAVMHEAGRRGDTALRADAKDWLRTLWTVQALGSLEKTTTSATALVQGSPTSIGDFSKCPLTLSVPGTRSMDYSPPLFPTHMYLSMATGLGAGSNRCTTTGGLWWPTETMLLAVNKGEGDVLTPQDMGLTSGEATILRDVMGYKTVGDYQAANNLFEQVKTLVHPDHKPPTPYTYVRTADGVASYFGSWEDGAYDGASTNGNKAAVYASRVDDTGAFTWLYPQSPYPKTGKCTSSCPAGRVGNQSCAKVSGTEYCMDFQDLVDSGIAYVIEWNQDEGLALMEPPSSGAGSCEDVTCNPGEVCLDGTCIVVMCHDDADCGRGQRCILNECILVA